MLTEKEKSIILPFMNAIYSSLEKKNNHFRFYTLNEDIFIVKYLSDAESDNGLDIEDENYEEFYEFYFEIVKVEKKSKDSKIRKGKWLEINYYNLPTKWETVENIDKK